MSENEVIEDEVVEEEVIEEEVEATDGQEDSSTSEDDNEDSSTSEDVDEDKQKIPYGRFKEVNEQKKTAMEMLNMERQARLDAEARLKEQQTPPPAPPVAVEMPRRDDFDDEDRYQEAWVKYNVSQVKSEANRIAEENRAREQQTIAQRKADEVNAKFNAKIDSAKDEMPDILESFEFVKMHTPSPEFAKALVSSEHSDKIINHLAKNPSEMAKVRAITDPIEHIKFIGSLEARIEPPKITKKTTKAPPPPTTLGGDSSSGKTKLKEMKKPKGGWTQKEYLAQRKGVYGY
jgi:hypothetical protein